MISTLLELVGMGLIAGAGWWVFPPLGLSLAGLAFVVVGYQLGGADVDPPKG